MAKSKMPVIDVNPGFGYDQAMTVTLEQYREMFANCKRPVTLDPAGKHGSTSVGRDDC